MPSVAGPRSSRRGIRRQVFYSAAAIHARASQRDTPRRTVHAAMRTTRGKSFKLHVQLVLLQSVAPSLDHLKQAQRDMSAGSGAAVEISSSSLRRTVGTTKLPTKAGRPASVIAGWLGQRNEVRPEPPTQLEVARLVAAIKRARMGARFSSRRRRRPRAPRTGSGPRSDLMASGDQARVVRRRRVSATA